MKRLSLEKLLNETKTAVVIIDVQNDFCHSDGIAGENTPYQILIENMMVNLINLVDEAHSNNVPVIFVKNVEDETTDSCAWAARPESNDQDDDSTNEGVCRRGTWGAEIYGIVPKADDIVFEKHRFSAFIDTPLNQYLKNRNIETLIFTGVATNICVESSARHAVMLDYHVILAEDACATWVPELHESTKTNISNWFGKVVQVDNITDIWNS